MSLFVLTCGLGGCFHATVNTGLQPGTTQIHRPWAKSFVYGLVPAETVEAMAACGSAGVARVETQMTFLNGLVAFVTFSIFTPMDILVTCGAGGTANLPQVNDAEALEAALKEGRPFLVVLGS